METAEGSAEGFLLENLLRLVQENYDLISGASSKVAKLSKSLLLLKSFVAEYTENDPDSKILKELARKIRELVYEAEDAIEEYIYYVSVQNNKGFLKKAIHAVDHAIRVRDVGKKIGEVSDKVMEMYEINSRISGEALRLKESVSAIVKMPKPSVPMTDKVIGFEDAAVKVINRLTGRNLDKITRAESDSKQNTEIEDLEVVSIVGMLGSGKTTLARKVLNDPIIEYEFFTRIFVPVSHEYNKREVYQTILIQGGFLKNIKELNDKTDEELVQLIKENLRNKYLVVMDDVWTPGAWEDLKGIFPDYKKGSRVLITTQHQFVANYSKLKIKPYNLRLLYPEESQKLLRMKVFDENDFPVELEMPEKEILERCKNLPLAIVVTAGILRNNRESKTWWAKVSHSVSLRGDQDGTDKLIRISYDHLPYQLKPCFLYLGVFPEDMEIPVWKLLRLWIAEGFIRQVQNVDMEEIAELYLRELVDRNLVMVGQRSSSGQIKTCLVHDTLRYFCKRMAIEENLFQEIKSQNEAISPSAIPSISNSRRLCVNTYLPDYISKKPSAERVRSFLSFAKDESTLQKELCPIIFKPFRLVKVFDINSVKLGDRLPVDLHKLFLLKYISISGRLSTLPRMMSNLVNLQTIIIDTTSNTLDIQANIWKMTRLRHLHANTSTILPECEQSSTGAILQIQTISAISPKSCTREVFERTPKLKKLGIRGNLCTLVEANGGESNLFDGLIKLKFLENLKLVNDDVNFKLRALPKENKFPANLTKLSLQNTNLDFTTEMSTLGKLPCLMVLKLKDNAFKGKHWQTEDGGFHYLEVLSIGATDLVDWKADASNFPVLKCLVLKHCRELKVIPAGLADVKSLEMIDLEFTSSSVVSSARKIKYTKTGKIKLKVYPPELQ